MKAAQLLDAIGEARDEFLRDIIILPEKKRVGPSKRKILTVILAAVLAVLLISCGVAAAIYGDGIHGWLEHYWKQLTGQELAQEQTLLIDKLSQDIGVTVSNGSLTITVDSAAGSEDMFYILIRVEGYRFGSGNQYGFGTRLLRTDPSLLPGDLSLLSYGIRYLGTDKEGAGLFLVDFCYGTDSADLGDMTALPITLTLKDLVIRSRGKETVVSEGKWDFSFTLDRSQLPEKRPLPDTQVTGVLQETSAETPVLLTDIMLSNTGIAFTYDSRNGEITVYGNISVLLKNGTRIEDGEGTGTIEEDRTTRHYVWHWPIPLDMEQIVSISIAGTEIPVSPGT